MRRTLYDEFDFASLEGAPIQHWIVTALGRRTGLARANGAEWNLHLGPTLASL